MKESAGNRLVMTKDGSPTFESSQFGVTYHSIHGAVQESEHVFIDAGLQHLIEQGKTELRIFEMGFGTGLNALLTAEFAKKNALSVRYQAVELQPLATGELEQFSNALHSLNQELFERIHNSDWEEEIEIAPFFALQKFNSSLLELALNAGIDLIYFDAFAPTAQPELWTQAVFEKLFGAMNTGAVLVTYCCKGDVRRAMIAAGFEVEKIPGPPGKREMIRARVPLS